MLPKLPSHVMKVTIYWISRDERCAESMDKLSQSHTINVVGKKQKRMLRKGDQ